MNSCFDSCNPIVNTSPSYDPSDLKTAAPVTDEELDLFAMYLSANMNAAAVGARQSITACVAKMFVRLKQERSDKVVRGRPLWQRDPQMWLLHICEVGLNPSASYQVCFFMFLSKHSHAFDIYLSIHRLLFIPGAHIYIYIHTYIHTYIYK